MHNHCCTHWNNILLLFRLFAAIYSHFAAHFFFLSNTTSFMSALNTFIFHYFLLKHTHKKSCWMCSKGKKDNDRSSRHIFWFFYIYLFDVDVKNTFLSVWKEIYQMFCSIELFEHLQIQTLSQNCFFLHPRKLLRTTWCEIAFCSSYIISNWSERARRVQ